MTADQRRMGQRVRLSVFRWERASLLVPFFWFGNVIVTNVALWGSYGCVVSGGLVISALDHCSEFVHAFSFREFLGVTIRHAGLEDSF